MFRVEVTVSEPADALLLGTVLGAIAHTTTCTVVGEPGDTTLAHLLVGMAQFCAAPANVPADLVIGQGRLKVKAAE